MRTCFIALSFCVVFAAPSHASDRAVCQTIRDAAQTMVDATRSQIDQLSRVKFQDAAVIMKPMDRDAAYAMAQSRNETVLALQKFLDNQINYLGALDRCS